jgi:hypothetical protein
VKRLEGTYDLNEEQEQQVEALKLPLYLNLGACYLKSGDAKNTISSCNKVRTAHSPTNRKRHLDDVLYIPTCHDVASFRQTFLLSFLSVAVV